MSYLDWKVGDRVVCIDADWTIKIFIGGAEVGVPYRVPMDGEILTIASIEAGAGELGTGREDGVYLSFEEIPLHQTDGVFSTEIRWDAGNFRKLQPRKTDISIFTAMLHDQRQKVPV